MGIRLIPIYATPEGEGCFGYSFRPPKDGGEPCEWAWITDDVEFVPSDGEDCERLLFDGHYAAIYPHELMYRSRAMKSLPLSMPDELDAEASEESPESE